MYTDLTIDTITYNFNENATNKLLLKFSSFVTIPPEKKQSNIHFSFIDFHIYSGYKY